MQVAADLPRHKMERSPNNTQDIHAIPCNTASFVVTIDGKPYAGFVSRASAELAVAMWLGEVDAYGEPLPPHERGLRGWRAVRGRRLEIVERGFR
jgi:hypothetical protein